MINENEIYVTIEEMCITNAPLTILESMELMKHGVYLSGVRKESEDTLLISKKSGHRPLAHELSKGRDGSSEHTTFHLEDRGAVDIIYKKKQIEIILKGNFYTRVCHYPKHGFAHLDRKPMPQKGKVYYYESETLTSPWQLKKII